MVWSELSIKEKNLFEVYLKTTNFIGEGFVSA